MPSKSDTKIEDLLASRKKKFPIVTVGSIIVILLLVLFGIFLRSTV